MVVMGATSLSSGAGLVAMDVARKSIAARPSLFATVPGAAARPAARPAIEASALVGGPAADTPEGGTSRALIIGAGVLAVLGLGLVAIKLRKRKK